MNLFISSLIRPADPNEEKLLPYECGEESSGTGFVRFNPRFYIIGLIFLIFDIETVFIFPWAVILKGAGPFVLIERWSSSWPSWWLGWCTLGARAIWNGSNSQHSGKATRPGNNDVTPYQVRGKP